MKTLIDRMVDRFLGWRLPANFGPDAGISFTPYHPQQTPDSPIWPSGTNLFTADQARAMFEYVLTDDRPSVGSILDAMVRDGDITEADAQDISRRVRGLPASPPPPPTTVYIRPTSTTRHNPILQFLGDTCQCWECKAGRKARSSAGTSGVPPVQNDVGEYDPMHPQFIAGFKLGHAAGRKRGIASSAAPTGVKEGSDAKWVATADRLPQEADGEFAFGNVLAQRADRATHFEVVSIEFIAKVRPAYVRWLKIIPDWREGRVPSDVSAHSPQWRAKGMTTDNGEGRK